MKYKRYVILYGKTGVSKEFISSRRAIQVGKKLVKKGFRGNVSIDKITVYPKAKIGQTDWTQSHYKTIK